MSATDEKNRVVVVQDGARRHYAVPLALQTAGMLSQVYTNWYSAPWRLDSILSTIIGWSSKESGKRMRQRYAPELDPGLVRSNPLRTVRQLRSRKRFSSEIDYYLWEAKDQANWIASCGFGSADTLFGFVRNIHPDLLVHARSLGLQTIVDQIIAPYTIESREFRTQCERFPGWSLEEHSQSSEWESVEARTWENSNHVTCGSCYVKDGLVELGVDADRISVISYPLDVTKFAYVDRRNRSGPLVVGFLGSIGLRKGAPYFLEVASRLASEKLRFVMVGPLGIPQEVVRSKSSVEFVGSVSRAEVNSWMRKFDIFYFPSTCEGSAGSAREAMATGLPVVCSPNTGIVELTEDSHIEVNYDDIEGAANAIEKLADNAERRHALGLNARRNSELSDLANYQVRLANVIRQLHGRQVVSSEDVNGAI